MTWEEALESILKDESGHASPEGKAFAEQIEANRKAIEDLRKAVSLIWDAIRQ